MRMERQMDRPPAEPKAYRQTEKETGTETEGQTQGQTQGQRQTSCRTQGIWTKRQRGTEKEGQTQDRDRQTDLMQDPRQRASQFQTLVDVEDQVGFIVETMLSLVVIVPEEQLVHLGQTSHILDPIN